MTTTDQSALVFLCVLFILHRWWISFAPNLGRCIIVSMENGLHRLGGVLVSQRINQIRAKWLRDVWELWDTCLIMSIFSTFTIYFCDTDIEFLICKRQIHFFIFILLYEFVTQLFSHSNRYGVAFILVWILWIHINIINTKIEPNQCNL